MLNRVMQLQNNTGWWFGCHFLFSHSVGNVIIPIDELFFLRGVAQPPTRTTSVSTICTSCQRSTAPKTVRNISHGNAVALANAMKIMIATTSGTHELYQSYQQERHRLI